MSRKPVEVVRDFCDLVATEDFDRMTAALDPAVVWYGTRGGLDENRVIRGPDAVLEYLTEIRDPWERLDFEAERVIDAGNTVVVFWRETGRSRHTELEVRSETAMIFKVRGGRIAEATGYLDRDEAVRAAGLTD